MGHVIITYEILDDDGIPFDEEKPWWAIACFFFLIKAALHLYSICLILKSTSIMKKIARKKGNPDSTRDIIYITVIGVLCFLAFCIEFIGFLIATVLVATDAITPKNRDSAGSVANASVSLILFIAYTLLIRIFWQYVININKAREKKVEKKAIKAALEPQFSKEIKIVK